MSYFGIKQVLYSLACSVFIYKEFIFRYEFHFDLPKASDSDHKLMEKTDIRKAPSPLNSPMFAGSAYYAWKREAVEFMITGKRFCFQQ